MERRIASRLSLDSWSLVRFRHLCVRVIPDLNSVREIVYFRSFWTKQKLSAFVQTSSNFQWVTQRYKCVRQCSPRDSRSASRITSRASPSVLEIKKRCNSWSLSSVISHCWRFVTEIDCLSILLLKRRSWEISAFRRLLTVVSSLFSVSIYFLVKLNCRKIRNGSCFETTDGCPVRQDDWVHDRRVSYRRGQFLKSDILEQM